MTDPQTTCALVIGVGHCVRGSNWNLPLAGPHAIQFAEWLASNRIGVPVDNIFLFLSKKDIDQYKARISHTEIIPRHANREEFLKVLEDILYKRDGSLLYFFASGHGLLDSRDHQLLFLEDWTEDFHSRSIDVSWLLRRLKAHPYGSHFPNQIAYLDACSRYAEEVIGGSRVEGLNPASVGTSIQGVHQAALFAASRGQIAYAGEFGERLLKILKSDSLESPHDIDSVYSKMMQGWNVEGQDPLYMFHVDGQGTEKSEWVHKEGGIYSAANLKRDPRFVHRIELSQGFVGRQAEREFLVGWLDSGTQNVCVLAGLPGMGTTSTAWVWLHEDVLGIPILSSSSPRRDKQSFRPESGLEGVFWWSLKEDLDLRNCLKQALAYMSDSTIDTKLSDHELVEALFEIFREKKFLMILDGFDRLFDPQSGTLKARERKDASDPIEAETTLSARFVRGVVSNVFLSRLLFVTYLLPPESQLDQVGPSEEGGIAVSD